jgi:hypothetical protein
MLAFYAPLFDSPLATQLLLYLRIYLYWLGIFQEVMDRRDEGHLHPKLEDPRPKCLGRELNLGLRGGRREF